MKTAIGYKLFRVSKKYPAKGKWQDYLYAAGYCMGYG